MKSAMTFVAPGEHSFPDPEMQALMDCEVHATLRDRARDEREYSEQSSFLSEALAEREFWRREMRRKPRFQYEQGSGPGYEFHAVDPVEYDA